MATKAAASPMKLHGSASRTAATKGSSPRRRMTGTARASKARKALEPADDGLDATDDLDIARVDWRHRAILRLEPDAAGLAVEAFHRRLAVDHRDDDLAVLRGALRPNEDEIPVHDRSFDHRIALYAQHERIRRARHELRRKREFAFDILLRGNRNAGGNPAEDRHDDDLRRGRRC